MGVVLGVYLLSQLSRGSRDKLLQEETQLPDSPQYPDSIEHSAPELADQACEEMIENLKKSVAERRAALTELAAYDQEIGIREG